MVDKGTPTKKSGKYFFVPVKVLICNQMSRKYLQIYEN